MRLLTLDNGRTLVFNRPGRRYFVAGMGDAAAGCPEPPFPWWMVALGAAAGVAAGYFADELTKKGKKPA